jgi:hypothetical protein
MSKTEVCEYLGKSKRTVEGYVASGRLAAQYFNGPNGKTSIFERFKVEIFKEEMESERLIPVVREPAALARIPTPIRADAWDALPAQLANLASFAQEINERYAPKAVYVSLKDACAITGLSAATIRALAEGVEIKTRPYGGGVRYRRADLEAL